MSEENSQNSGSKENNMFDKKSWDCPKCGRRFGVTGIALKRCPFCGETLVFHSGDD
jgi:rubrerythrin